MSFVASNLVDILGIHTVTQHFNLKCAETFLCFEKQQNVM